MNPHRRPRTTGRQDSSRGLFQPQRQETINHSKAYADCLVHTNTIESFWALLKRGIVGQFHKVSAKYLDRYLDEFCYRYNGRELDGGVLFDKTVMRMLAAS